MLCLFCFEQFSSWHLQLDSCRHRIGAVLRNDKHLHAVLNHCLALLQSYDSRTAVTTLCPSHCFSKMEDSEAELQALLASALIHCLSKLKTLISAF